MTLKAKILVLLLISILPSKLFSQELNCRIQIVSDEVEESNKQIYQTLKEAINEFMNSRTWTSDKFQRNERIECNILINIKEHNNEQFKANFQVTSTRPVYGTTYNSPILNYIDNGVQFQYVEFQPLQYIEGGYTNNLVSLLSFYAYLIIGYDYDSFSELGGSSFFKKAEAIANAAQSSSDEGWKPSSTKPNRFMLIDQLLNSRFEPFRKAFYRYHRLGFDIMSKDVDKGRSIILESMKTVKAVNEDFPNPYILKVFFDAKSTEIAEVFSKADAMEKRQVLDILRKVDINNINKYEQKIK